MTTTTRLAALLSLGLVLALPGRALAIGSITDGDVTFAYTTFAQGNNLTTRANFTGAGPGDQVYENWWFFRVSGDSRETPFTAPTSEDYSLGNYATLDWADMSSRGLFSATLNIAVMDPGTGGNLFQEMVITALGAVTLEIFHYADFEVGGSSGTDSASLVSSSPDIQISVSDGTNSVPWIGYGADAYKVTRYATNGNPRSIIMDLTDNGVDNMNNTGLPWAPGDFTGAFQWSLSLTAGQSVTLLSQWGANAPLLPPTSMPTPEPGSAVLMAIGLFGLGLMGRRARTQRPLR